MRPWISFFPIKWAIFCQKLEEKWSKYRFFFKFWIQFGLHKNVSGLQVGPKLRNSLSKKHHLSYFSWTFCSKIELRSRNWRDLSFKMDEPFLFSEIFPAKIGNGKSASNIKIVKISFQRILNDKSLQISAKFRHRSSIFNQKVHEKSLRSCIFTWRNSKVQPAAQIGFRI